MIVGSIFCVFAMILLGYTRAFANIFSSYGTKFVSFREPSPSIHSSWLKEM